MVHQDVYLPAGWDRRVMRQLREAERRFGPIGIAGVYGVGEVDEPADGPPRAERIGWVVDRGRLLREGPDLPARVATLDELLLILPRGTPLRADPALGFHLYGADLCLQARERGLAVVALGDALPAQLAERRVARGVLRQRGGLRPQVGAPAARGHAVRRVRSGGRAAPAGQRGWTRRFGRPRAEDRIAGSGGRRRERLTNQDLHHIGTEDTEGNYPGSRLGERRRP